MNTVRITATRLAGTAIRGQGRRQRPGVMMPGRRAAGRSRFAIEVMSDSFDGWPPPRGGRSSD